MNSWRFQTGVVAVIRTLGERINFHRHLHFLVTEGGTDETDYVVVDRIIDQRSARFPAHLLPQPGAGSARLDFQPSWTSPEPGFKLIRAGKIGFHHNAAVGRIRKENYYPLKSGGADKPLALSRAAWSVFPLLALIFLILAFFLVITPIRK